MWPSTGSLQVPKWQGGKMDAGNTKEEEEEEEDEKPQRIDKTVYCTLHPFNDIKMNENH